MATVRPGTGSSVASSRRKPRTMRPLGTRSTASTSMRRRARTWMIASSARAGRATAATTRTATEAENARSAGPRKCRAVARPTRARVTPYSLAREGQRVIAVAAAAHDVDRARGVDGARRDRFAVAGDARRALVPEDVVARRHVAAAVHLHGQRGAVPGHRRQIAAGALRVGRSEEHTSELQ